MFSQNVKDAVDIFCWVVTACSVLGFVLTNLYARRDTKAAGIKAMSQINLLTENHFPHMAADIAEVKLEAKTSNEILTQLRLGQVETNTLLRNRP